LNAAQARNTKGKDGAGEEEEEEEEDDGRPTTYYGNLVCRERRGAQANDEKEETMVCFDPSLRLVGLARVTFCG